MPFEPKLEILPSGQRQLWPELGQTPKQFVLYGGTAIALRLGHRQSIDFDFFSTESFSPSELLESIPYLKGGVIQQSSENTLTCLVEKTGGFVQLSFFGGLPLHHVYEPDILLQPELKIATLLDLAATKAKVILERASWKDYIDLHRILAFGIKLPTILSAAQTVYGKTYNPLLTLKALSYFGEGDLHLLAPEIRKDLLDAVHNVDIACLPKIPHKTRLFSSL